MTALPIVGVSACLFHPDPARTAFAKKTLLYVEESMLTWIQAGGALPVMVPRAAGGLSVDDLVEQIDGLVLHGGADISPHHYGEAPARPEWAGDAIRDAYEMELVRACMRLDRPVLGVCRGMQLVNVTLGGSLYQDVPTMTEKGIVHRDADVYDRLHHDVVLEQGWLAEVYRGSRPANAESAANGPVRVCSVHHQAVKRLAEHLVVEARAQDDGLVEAFRYAPAPTAAARAPVPFVVGVQWHPEFHDENNARELLASGPLLRAFLDECAARKRARSHPHSPAPSRTTTEQR